MTESSSSNGRPRAVDFLRRTPARFRRMREQGEALPWLEAHDKAVAAAGDPLEGAGTPKLKFERALVLVLQGWALYADAHREAYTEGEGEPAEGIATDGVLGDPWVEIGKAVDALLNGEKGRLDGGLISKFVRETMIREGRAEE